MPDRTDTLLTTGPDLQEVPASPTSVVRLVKPQAQPLHQLAEDKKALFQASKTLEEFLEVEFLQKLQDLNTAFSLPDASISLCEDLRKWREEVELLFPLRLMMNRKNTLPKVPQKERKSKTVFKRPTAVRLLSGNLLVERTNWKTFSSSCKALARGLKQFSAALEHLAESRDVNNGRDCRLYISKFMVTITEIQVTLKEETRSSDDKDDKEEERRLDPKHNPDLRNFVRARLDVCREQLNDVLSALKQYCHTEIPRVREAQKLAFEALVNVTQVSTFFAGVVASTLQFSLAFDKQSAAIVTINTLWLSSLVLGIGSAFNSLLAMTMRKVVSSTPLNAQPWYITFWIRQSYAALLVIAVIMYVLGLGIYVIKTQHVVAAVIPCVLGGACAIGVSIVSWRHVRDILVNWWRSRHERVTKEGEESDDAFMKHLDQVIVDNNNAELFREFFPMDDDESSIDEKVQLEEEQVPEEMERYNPHLSRAYINYLQHVRQGAKSGLFSDFKRGRIEHMRCSPDGRWLVVCYELACLVYDVKNNFEYQNLTQEDAQQSAEHAEWSPTGEYLLTRTKKELRLWKTPLEVPGSEGNKFELLKKRFGLPGGHYRYIKWVNRDDFLLLTDGTDIFFVNRERGLREVNRLAVPDDFKVTQVFPLTPRFDTILCLAKKKVEIDDTKGEADSEGVDYLLVLSKGQTLLGKILRRVRIGASDGGTRLQRSDYVLNQKKLLHRNVTNVKICRNNQFILINYDGNELGMIAPELWQIRDKAGMVDIDVSESKGTLRKLFVPNMRETVEWGEASFAGPTHDIILCEINGELRFYHFDRSRDAPQLQLRHSMNLDFNEFDKPIFTWGDTATRPVMFVTNADGYGHLSFWSIDQAMLEAASMEEPAQTPDEAKVDQGEVLGDTVVESPKAEQNCSYEGVQSLIASATTSA